jgi:CRISPR system Cascade subunit CasB
MEPNIVIKGDSAIGSGLKRWWSGLQEDRASRAMLRRCATLDDVVMSPAYQRFYRYMLACGWPANAAEWQKDKLAAIAGLAAWVKIDSDANLPYRMSELVGERPLVSELRFRTMLRLETTEELFGSLRRALPLVGNTTSLIQLASDVYWWNDATRKRWAYNYRWAARPAA